MTQKKDLELAKIKEADSPNFAKAEKNTTELLFLEAEVGNLKKKMTTAQAVFQLHTNLLTREAHQPWNIIIGADRVFAIH